MQVDSLLAEPQGKPKNTGVGSLYLLQQIFLTQESNRGLLHCRQILYQLNYEGSKQTQFKVHLINHHCLRSCYSESKFKCSHILISPAPFISVKQTWKGHPPSPPQFLILHPGLALQLPHYSKCIQGVCVTHPTPPTFCLFVT